MSAVWISVVVVGLATIAIKAAPRLISCTGDRTPAQEVLATRNL